MDSPRRGGDDGSGPEGLGGLSADERAALPPGARSFLDAMERRYACKRYDPARPLGKGLERYILECGRLSPSSFGLEHWKFAAVTETGLKRLLMAACLDQEAVGTAALVVTILVHRARDYRPESDFVRQRAERFPGGLEVFLGDYRGYYGFLSERGELEHWARAQAYIACSNMMTGAAAAGVDSCAIEGYKEGRVLELLDADPLSWRVGVVVVFGYGDEPVRERIREPIGAMAEYR